MSHQTSHRKRVNSDHHDHRIQHERQQGRHFLKDWWAKKLKIARTTTSFFEIMNLSATPQPHNFPVPLLFGGTIVDVSQQFDWDQHSLEDGFTTLQTMRTYQQNTWSLWADMRLNSRRHGGCLRRIGKYLNRFESDRIMPTSRRYVNVQSNFIPDPTTQCSIISLNQNFLTKIRQSCR